MFFLNLNHKFPVQGATAEMQAGSVAVHGC